MISLKNSGENFRQEMEEAVLLVVIGIRRLYPPGIFSFKYMKGYVSCLSKMAFDILLLYPSLTSSQGFVIKFKKRVTVSDVTFDR